MAKQQSLREQVARMLREWRGVDPDAPITIIPPAVEEEREVVEADKDGKPVTRKVKHLRHPEPLHHPTAWHGYAPLADKIIKAVKRGNDGGA